MIGERLKKLRENKNMTQGDVAEALGVNTATISKYEYFSYKTKSNSK